MISHLKRQSEREPLETRFHGAFRKKIQSMGNFEPLQANSIIVYKGEKTSLKSLHDTVGMGRPGPIPNIGQTSPIKNSVAQSPKKNLSPKKIELPGIKIGKKIQRINDNIQTSWLEFPQKYSNVCQNNKLTGSVIVERGTISSSSPTKKEKQMAEVLENIVKAKMKLDKKKSDIFTKNTQLSSIEERAIFMTDSEYRPSTLKKKFKVGSKQEVGERSLNISILKNMVMSLNPNSLESLDLFDSTGASLGFSTLTPLRKKVVVEKEKAKPNGIRFKSLDQDSTYMARLSKQTKSPEKKADNKKILIKIRREMGTERNNEANMPVSSIEA